MGDIFVNGGNYPALDEIFAIMGCCEDPDMHKHIFLLLTKRPLSAAAYAQYRADKAMSWPPNVWMGYSLTTQHAVGGITNILKVPAMHYVSVEPMLEPVTIPTAILRKLDWVICGAETGPQAGHFKLEWAYELKHECDRNNVPFFFKSAGPHIKNPEDLIEARQWPEPRQGDHQWQRLLSRATTRPQPNKRNSNATGVQTPNASAGHA